MQEDILLFDKILIWFGGIQLHIKQKTLQQQI